MTSAIHISDNWHIYQSSNCVGLSAYYRPPPTTAHWAVVLAVVVCSPFLWMVVIAEVIQLSGMEPAAKAALNTQRRQHAGYRPADGTAGRCLPRRAQRRPCTWAEHSIYIYSETSPTARCSQTSALRGAVSYCCG